MLKKHCNFNAKLAENNANPIWNRLLSLADDRDITVYTIPLTAAINGIYFRKKEVKAIGIKNSLSDYQKNFVLAHELGHSVLHKNCGQLIFTQTEDEKQRIQKAEREADRFANKLIALLVRKMVKQ